MQGHLRPSGSFVSLTEGLNFAQIGHFRQVTRQRNSGSPAEASCYLLLTIRRPTACLLGAEKVHVGW